MAKKSKKYSEVVAKLDNTQKYSVSDAVKYLKENSFVKFDPSVEISFNLGLDVKQADQQIRTTIVLPNGTGKTSKILVIAKTDVDLKAAETARATHVMDEEAISKIEGGWLDFDIIVAPPDMMPKLGKVAKILGPKGLMPNPKLGTVTTDIAGTVSKINAGQVELRVDKEGNLSLIAGKLSFDNKKIEENIQLIIDTVVRLKPAAAKGTYIKSLTVSSTMMPGVKINLD